MSLPEKEHFLQAAVGVEVIHSLLMMEKVSPEMERMPLSKESF